MIKESQKNLSKSNPDENAAPTKKKGSRGGWLFLAILIGLIAASASGYAIYRLEIEVNPKLDSVTTQSATSIQQINTLKQTDQNLETKINELISKTEQLDSTDMSLTEELDDAVRSITYLYKKRDNSVDAWRIEEIRQLIAIGNHRLQFAGDIATATETRKIADHQLERLNDPRFVPVRRALNDEIAILEQTSTISISSISLQILAYARSVNQLSLRIEDLSESPNVDVNELQFNSSEPNSNNLWTQFKQDVSSLIRVRKTKDRITPALSQDQQYVAFEHLRLLLQTANLAALQGRQEIYTTALEDAIAWLQAYYVTSDPKVSATMDSLNELSKKTIATTIPEVAESANILRSILSDG